MDLTTDTLKKDWQETKEDARLGIETAAHKAEDMGHQIRNSAENGYGSIKDTFEKVDHKTEDTIENR